MRTPNFITETENPRENLDLRKLSYFIHDLTSTFADEVTAILHDTSTILELDRMKII